MNLNLDKCGILFLNGSPPKKYIPDKTSILGIPIVNNYKYMRVIIDKNLGTKFLVETLKSKVKKIIKIIYTLNYKRTHLSVKIHSLKSFLLGLIQYRAFTLNTTLTSKNNVL